MSKLNIENVIFCESVRPEIGGKHTLLGASAPELNIAEIPSNIFVAIWISGTPTNLGPFTSKFKAKDASGTNLIEADLNGEFTTLGKTSMVIGSFPLMINSEGVYSFEWNFDNTKWEKIGELLIHHVPIQTTNLSSR